MICTYICISVTMSKLNAWENWCNILCTRLKYSLYNTYDDDDDDVSIRWNIITLHICVHHIAYLANVGLVEHC